VRAGDWAEAQNKKRDLRRQRAAAHTACGRGRLRAATMQQRVATEGVRRTNWKTAEDFDLLHSVLIAARFFSGDPHPPTSLAATVGTFSFQHPPDYHEGGGAVPVRKHWRAGCRRDGQRLLPRTGARSGVPSSGGDRSRSFPWPQDLLCPMNRAGGWMAGQAGAGGVPSAPGSCASGCGCLGRLWA